MRRMIFSFFLLGASMASISTGAPSAQIKVVPREIHFKTSHGEFNEPGYVIVKKLSDGKEDPSFHEIPCFAQGNEPSASCKPFILANSHFLVADCFIYNAVASACRLLRFNPDGTPDPDFIQTFSTDHDELVGGSPQHVIKTIKKIDVLKNGQIQITGTFISPLVGWDHSRAAQDIGDEAGKACLVLLAPDGRFISYSLQDK
jgi:hypothetical protein